uniref:Uncharacterized protein n=1 Tax=Timema poppense TaxID=170557 RepID=A0A7R9DCF1_TIMPO|nr:unnamed protein product [Timema poppensis]
MLKEGESRSIRCVKEVYSSPMASLVLTDSSQLTSDSQNLGCFSCCMETGLRIYNVDPLVEKAHFGIGKIRTSISPSSAVELNTTSALANHATEAGS